MDNYERLSQVGEGTYGVVMKCRHKHSGMIVAIKRFKEKDEDGAVRKTALREVRILRQLHHENIVNLIEVFRQGGKLYLVFEFVEGNVLDEMEKHQPAGLPADLTKRITWQVLKSIDYCHSHNVMHRDVKPENLLVTRSGIVKLCDFGFAREIDDCDVPGYTDYVATRWYRSPELLVGQRDYTRSVDVWAIGCLMAEMLSGAPLFPGETDLDQLHKIVKVLGPLTQQHRDTFISNPLYEGVAIPTAVDEDGDSQMQANKHQQTAHNSLVAKLPAFTAADISFLLRCLAMNSSERSECNELLHHEFFDEAFKATVPQELHNIAERERSELIACLKRAKRLDTSLLRHLLGSNSPVTNELPSSGSSNASSTTSPGAASSTGTGSSSGGTCSPPVVGSPAALKHAIGGNEKHTSFREDLFASPISVSSSTVSSAARRNVTFANTQPLIIPSTDGVKFPQLPATPRATCTVAPARISMQEGMQNSQRMVSGGRHRRPVTPHQAGNIAQQQQLQQTLFPLATVMETTTHHLPELTFEGQIQQSQSQSPQQQSQMDLMKSTFGKHSRKGAVTITATKSPWGNPLPSLSSQQSLSNISEMGQVSQSSQQLLQQHLRKQAAATTMTSGLHR